MARYAVRMLVAIALWALASCASTPSRPAGHFIQPVPGFDISSGFGRRNGRPHNGLDFRAPRGTVIRASADGVVSFAGWQTGFGRIVILDHSRGTQTYYAHMQGFAVTVGQEVMQGEVIGFVGTSGNATGPHLHFEVRQGGKPLDPLLVLGTSR
ncbi:MAG: M23 family metallopeptidase [Pseudomonadota bacterium]